MIHFVHSVGRLILDIRRRLATELAVVFILWKWKLKERMLACVPRIGTTISNHARHIREYPLHHIATIAALVVLVPSIIGLLCCIAGAAMPYILHARPTVPAWLWELKAGQMLMYAAMGWMLLPITEKKKRTT